MSQPLSTAICDLLSLWSAALATLVSELEERKATHVAAVMEMTALPRSARRKSLSGACGDCNKRSILIVSVRFRQSKARGEEERALLIDWWSR